MEDLRSFFSLVLRRQEQSDGPIMFMADATCDKCGEEFLVRNPTEAETLLHALAFHMLICPQIPKRKSPEEIRDDVLGRW